MNIGIIVYSKSGNTESTARRVQESISTTGHQVKTELITIKGELKPGETNIEFENRPDPGEYDLLFFGAPVQAFSAALVMSSYLDKLSSLQNKKVFCFVTKGLPFNWTGGNRALNQMKKICKEKGAKVSGTGIVKWGKNRDQDIEELVQKVKTLISKL